MKTYQSYTLSTVYDFLERVNNYEKEIKGNTLNNHPPLFLVIENGGACRAQAAGAGVRPLYFGKNLPVFCL